MPVNRKKKGFLLERGLEEVPGAALDWLSQNKQRNNQKFAFRTPYFAFASQHSNEQDYLSMLTPSVLTVSYPEKEKIQASQPTTEQTLFKFLQLVVNVHTRRTPEVPRYL